MGVLDVFDADTMAQLKALSQPDAESKAQALNMGLLSAGLGMLAANRGYSTSQAMSNAIGMGGMHGLNSYQRDIQQGQRDQQEKLGMGMMLSKMKKENDMQDLQKQVMQNFSGMFNPVEAPRPYQGQVSGAFQIDSPEQLQTLDSDYQKLLKVNPEEAAKVKESLVQQGLIKPTMVAPQADWQKFGQMGVMTSLAGLKGGDAILKYAEMTQPNAMNVSAGGQNYILDKVTGKPMGVGVINQTMTPKELADSTISNERLKFETGVNALGNGGSSAPGLSPKAAQDITQKGQESFNSNWVENTYQPVQAAGNAAGSILTQVQTLRQIPIETGWGTEAKAGAASVLAGLGFAPKNAEMFAANAQKFQQVASERLWTVLNTAKGPQTEGDADRATKTFAALKNIQEANSFILDLTEATANRDQMKARFYQDGYGLAKKNGEFDRVDREWRKIQPSIWNDPIMQKWVRK